MNLIEGAQYRRGSHTYRLEGIKRRTVFFRDEVLGELLEVPREEAMAFSDTGVHDHANFCCTVHNTHASPHRGCILR